MRHEWKVTMIASPIQPTPLQFAKATVRRMPNFSRW